MQNQIPNELAVTTFSNNLLLIAMKFFLLISFAFYILFALILTRQVDVMSKTVETPLSANIRLLSYIHLCVSIVALIFAFLYLH